MKKIAMIVMILGNFFLFFGIVLIAISDNELYGINKEVELVSTSLNNKTVDQINIDNFEKKIYIFNKNNHEKVLNYLKKVVKVSTNILKLKNDKFLINFFSSENYNDDFVEKSNYLNEKSMEIEKIKDEYIKLLNSELKIDNSIVDNNLKKINITDYSEIIDNSVEMVNNYKLLINYMNSNKDYELINNNLVFSNKKSYEEYEKIIANFKNNDVNIISSKMVDDNESPIIEVSDITIYEGDSFNLKKYAKCYDKVDGSLDCTVQGSIDKNTKGIYPVVIIAKDLSGNISSKKINVNVIERNKLRYYMEIIRNQNTIVVYELDKNGEYSKIANVFLCSTGIGGRTPTGVFYSKRGNAWGSLIGGVYGQYYTVITGSILLHSVPYYSKSKSSLKYNEYNKLGSQASAGCVRVSVGDAKWIYDNCPSGMKIKIYDGELPDGVEKPTSIKIDVNSPYRGWDPTDPDSNNPWHNTAFSN